MASGRASFSDIPHTFTGHQSEREAPPEPAVVVQSIAPMEKEFSDSAVNCSSSSADTMNAKGVEELEKFLSTFNSELAAESNERTENLANVCSTSNIVTTTRDVTCQQFDQTSHPVAFDVPITTAGTTTLETMDFTESGSISDVHRELKAEYSGLKETLVDALSLPQDPSNLVEHHLTTLDNAASTVDQTSTRVEDTSAPVEANANSTSSIVNGQQTGQSQQQQGQLEQQPRTGRQLLIPVDCSRAMLSGAQVQIGSTVLLPVIPTVLPDGSIELRITGQAVAVPPSISLPGPDAATQRQLPVQQRQQQSVMIMVGNGAGDSTTGEKPKKIQLNREAKRRRKAAVSTDNNASFLPATKKMVLDGGIRVLSGTAEQTISVDRHDPADENTTATREIGEFAETGRSGKKLMKRAVFQCEFCDYTNVKKYLLIRHMKSHSEDRPYVCHVCEKGFKTANSLQNHVNTHTGVRPHQCQMCEASFTTSGEMVRHVKYKHTQEKPHKCPHCDYASVELSKLRRHIRSHTGERPYQCRKCEYASLDMYKLKRHMRVHTGEKPYKCDVCQRRFTQSNSLKAHKLIHTGTKPVYQCEYCPSSCGRKTDLKIHIQKLHTPLERPLICKKCMEEFEDRYSFKQHQRTHESDRSYSCTLCNYSAFTQRHLDVHMMVHRSEKPFQCPVPLCAQSFRQKSQLKRHVGTKHGSEVALLLSEETDKLQCRYCSKVFRIECNLHAHEEHCRGGTGTGSKRITSTRKSAVPRKRKKRSVVPVVEIDDESGEEQDGEADDDEEKMNGEDEDEDDYDEADDEGQLEDSPNYATTSGNHHYGCNNCGELFSHLVQLQQHCQLEHIGAEVSAASATVIPTLPRQGPVVDSKEVVLDSIDTNGKRKTSNGLLALFSQPDSEEEKIDPTRRRLRRRRPCYLPPKAKWSKKGRPQQRKKAAKNGLPEKMETSKERVDLEEKRRKDLETSFGFADVEEEHDEPTTSAHRTAREETMDDERRGGIGIHFDTESGGSVSDDSDG